MLAKRPCLDADGGLTGEARERARARVAAANAKSKRQLGMLQAPNGINHEPIPLLILRWKSLLALAVACARGLTVRAFLDAVLTAGRVSAPLLVLLMAAQFYGRALAFTGSGSSIQSMFIDSGLAPGLVVVAMVGVWFVLGMFIDSASIMLLTVPIFAPIAKALGIDPVAFAIMGILAIEAGLLTPPFGVLVFTVKASVDEAGVTLGEIFWGAVPYWICLLLVVVAVWVVPTLATGLPRLLLEK